MKSFLRFVGIAACIAIAAVFAWRSFPQQESASMQNAVVTPESITIPLVLSGPNGAQKNVTAEVADSDSERQRGLMFRKDLAADHGMLFLFEREMPLSFWMKNTLIPLDVLYFDSMGRFVSGATMTPCTADPCAAYPSDGPAMFALEIPAGLMRAWGVGQGWRIDGDKSALW